MKTVLPTIMALVVSASTIAQKAKKNDDREAIKSMCGCFEVTFNFA
ncbi:unnamed protein product [Ectocarpus sp. 12 AP-2014]